MPDQITVAEFVAETNEDYKSPTASNFTTRMTHCRNTVTALEEKAIRFPEVPGNRVTLSLSLNPNGKFEDFFLWLALKS
ncbi:Arf-GAP with SH3 domain, ANK repeat and PH domain-containing protein 2 [Anabarilius grahami]|uniref:Arf-GAP with SH3 domain, ANK repeat and PH domain-containing protein 2 n=1 Tax=Anabarilius grahami TaxID=495550 RepID=A0A3N0Z146_ANAGA|nr:Arf-GAP with SH3 domain, ANK repeat and PH domain-containing protein 2 [Anabarilius grahami]